MHYVLCTCEWQSKVLSHFQVLSKIALNIPIRIVFILGKEVSIGEGNHPLRRPDIKDSNFKYPSMVYSVSFKELQKKVSKRAANPVTYSFSQHLLSSYYVPGTFLGTGNL